MPTPAKLLVDLTAETMMDYEGYAPTTPGRPPSPKADDEMSIDSTDAFIPAPPPPRESSSVPASFQRSKFRIASVSARATTSEPASRSTTSAPTSRVASALPSRNGSPAWQRPSSGWGKLTSGRDQPRLYAGKEPYRVIGQGGGTLGQFGPSFYDVKCSKTGSPVRGARSARSSFARGARFDREKSKENAKPGQYGPGLYDIRCFKTGSPRGSTKGTPRWGAGMRFDREKCADNARYGQAPTASSGPPTVSNRGSPLWKGARPSAAFALPHVRHARLNWAAA